MNTGNHKERAHSKFSASGSERWLNCPYSVAAEEKAPPSKDSFWSKEGTLAHECLEAKLSGKPYPTSFDVTEEMIGHVERAAAKVRAILNSFGGRMLVEKRVWATFIHPEMFGTCDVIIAGNDRTLHIIDFKYGAGHVISPVKNTQLIQYALSAAESYDWDFDRVKHWILQPRSGTDWHKSWTIPIEELMTFWLPLWHKGVERVKRGSDRPAPGSYCHWCRAKLTCPAKTATRVEKITNEFNQSPLTNEVQTNGFKEESGEARQEKGKQKSKGKKEKPNPFQVGQDFY
jgi:hypothetical protein